MSFDLATILEDAGWDGPAGDVRDSVELDIVLERLEGLAAESNEDYSTPIEIIEAWLSGRERAAEWERLNANAERQP